MNPQDMLDYALGRLDGSSLDHVEREFARDDALRPQCDRLKRAVTELLDDGIEPPVGLRQRTLQLVASTPYVAPAPRRRPQPRFQEYLPRSVPFRWQDLAVAAGIFLAGVATLLPALHRGKMASNQAGCISNLVEIGRALGQYATAHRAYPKVEPGNYSAVVLVRLQDDGFLTSLHRAECPCNGPCEDGDELQDRVENLRHPDGSPPLLPARCDYAFNVGYCQAGSAVPCTPERPGYTPLVADTPSFGPTGTIHAGNSPNHGGRGQNVLYNDLSVRWHRFRAIQPGDHDVFLNENGQPSFGLHKYDFALIPGVIKVMMH